MRICPIFGRSSIRHILTFTSVLALAIAAPALAQKPGDDNAGSQGKGNSQSANKADKADKGNPAAGNAAKSRDSQTGKPNRTEARETGNQGRSTQTSDARSDNAAAKANKGSNKSGKSEARAAGRSDNSDRGFARSDYRKAIARPYDERGDRARFQFTDDDDRRRFALRYDRDFGPLSGFCPPGLAKKGNGCQPPGQAKKSEGNYLSRYSRFRDGDWRYFNGYAYQYAPGDNLINSFLPLVGGALFGGNKWPAAYQDYSVPKYYGSYYGRGDDYGYRYADRTIFSVNPQDQTIGGIVALLTGNDFEVGRQMPSGYEVYNVPNQYRDQYYDRPDANYRYSDGYVYQVDPTTRLISAAIQLIV